MTYGQGALGVVAYSVGEIEMPSFMYVRYEGDDDRIIGLLSQLFAPPSTNGAPPSRNAQQSATPSAPASTTSFDAVAFKRNISRAASDGRPGQQNAMIAWLSAGGEIELSKLWKAAGVKNQHDYSGIGASLTKNIRKAGGAKNWYEWYRNQAGAWVYKIAPELVDPLKRAFGIQ